MIIYLYNTELKMELRDLVRNTQNDKIVDLDTKIPLSKLESYLQMK